MGVFIKPRDCIAKTPKMSVKIGSKFELVNIRPSMDNTICL